MYVRSQGFMTALKPVNNTNVIKNEQVSNCSEVYVAGKKRIMCKSCRTGIWLLAKPERLSTRKVR